MKNRAQGPVLLLGAARLGLKPDQVESLGSRAGLEQMLFLPSIHGLAEAARQPKHLGSKIGAVMRVGKVEGLASRAGAGDAEPAGAVETARRGQSEIRTQGGVE